MGNRFSRGQNAPDGSAETAAPEQAAAKSAAAQPAEDSEISQTQQAVETENLAVEVSPQMTQLVCSGTEALALKSNVDEVPDADPESVAKETPGLVLIDPVLPVCVSSESVLAPLAVIEPVLKLAPEPNPEPEPVSDPEPVAKETPGFVLIDHVLPVCVASESVLAPLAMLEPVLQLEPEPVSEPEAVPEPEFVPEPEEEVEADPEPMSESVPAPTGATEPETDLFSQESLPEPAISSLSDLGVLAQSPQPIDIPPSSATAPVNAEEPSDVPVTQECQVSAEISVTPTLEPEKSEETSESEEKPMAVEAAGNLEQLVSVVSGEESISGLLKNLELTGNDLVADLSSTDVQIPDEM